MNITNIKVGGTTYAVGLPHFYFNDKKGNLIIETSETNVPNGKRGKINIESKDDIQLKPGDDIIFYSHHRALDKQDEVNVKNTDGVDDPVKLQLTATSLTLQNEFKTNIANRSEIFDINVNTGGQNGSNGKGYLKVRARAIDLRCEDHGGIALQPKGRDHNNTGNMNKIKFEHGGGDGLEFGTFNTEKTSIFTDEYRFNRDGVVKMASRNKISRSVTDSKRDQNDNTTWSTYEKQADDFYDIIADDDEQTTWHDIIKTSNALNQRKYGQKYTETSITSNGNLEIATTPLLGYSPKTEQIAADIKQYINYVFNFNNTELIEQKYNQLMYGAAIDNSGSVTGTTSEFILKIKEFSGIPVIGQFNLAHSDDPMFVFVTPVVNQYEEQGADFVASNGTISYNWTEVSASMHDLVPILTPRNNQYDCANINIESGKDIKLTAVGKLQFKGTLDFGKTFKFGETEEGIIVDKKFTAKNNPKDCDIIRINYTNNSKNTKTHEVITVTDDSYQAIETEIPAGMTQEIASVSLYDVAKLVNYMKANNQGPWATA